MPASSIWLCGRRAALSVNLIVDMPERRSDLLFRFLHQNEGTLSRRAREREFAALTDDEVERVQFIYREVLAGNDC